MRELTATFTIFGVVVGQSGVAMQAVGRHFTRTLGLALILSLQLQKIWRWCVLILSFLLTKRTWLTTSFQLLLAGNTRSCTVCQVITYKSNRIL